MKIVVQVHENNMTSFSWPWHYQFPPFFTIQKNSDTKLKQMEAWCSVVLSYHEHHKTLRIRLADIHTTPLFHNSKIDRKLSVDDVKEVLNELHKKGNLKWEDKNKTSCIVLWRTMNQWADILYNWVMENGAVNTVFTILELCQGADYENEQFYGLEDWFLVEIIQVLQSRGKAELIGEEGVKFFS